MINTYSSIDQQVLMYVDKLLKEGRYTIEEIDEMLPCNIQINSIDSSQLFYLSSEGCQNLNATLEELTALKKDYSKYIGPRDPVSFCLNKQLSQSYFLNIHLVDKFLFFYYLSEQSSEKIEYNLDIKFHSELGYPYV